MKKQKYVDIKKAIQSAKLALAEYDRDHGSKNTPQRYRYKCLLEDLEHAQRLAAKKISFDIDQTIDEQFSALYKSMSLFVVKKSFQCKNKDNKELLQLWENIADNKQVPESSKPAAVYFGMLSNTEQAIVYFSKRSSHASDEDEKNKHKATSDFLKYLFGLGVKDVGFALDHHKCPITEFRDNLAKLMVCNKCAETIVASKGKLPDDPYLLQTYDQYRPEVGDLVSRKIKLLDKKQSRAKRFVKRTIDNAPAMLVGIGTGALVRFGASAAAKILLGQFAAAAAVTTMPGILVTIGSAIAIGAVAGCVSKLVVTSIFGGAKKRQKNWVRNALLQGAAMGALGGGLGAGAMHWLMSHDFHGLFFHHAPHPAEPSSLPSDHPVIAPDGHEATVPTETPAPSGTEGHHPDPSSAGGDQASTGQPTSGDTTQPMDSVSQSVDLNNVKDLLSEAHFKRLPNGLQKLALSKDPATLARFCKEVSYRYINGPHANDGTKKLAASLIQRGLDITEKAGLHNGLTEKLHADMAFLKAWGIGTEKNVSEAISLIRHSGRAVNNYGGRLMHLFRPLNG